MKKGPPGLTVRTAFFDRRRRGKDRGAFILEIPRKVQFGRAAFTIYHKQDDKHGFKIEAKSAVLWDVKIHAEEWRGKGIGSEWLGYMKEFAKSRGAERFYAANVQTESEGFFSKMGFVRTDDPDWWIMKELCERF